MLKKVLCVLACLYTAFVFLAVIDTEGEPTTLPGKVLHFLVDYYWEKSELLSWTILLMIVLSMLASGLYAAILGIKWGDNEL